MAAKMVRILYQGNDEIPTHIICQVSARDAEREAALAIKFKKPTTVGRRLGRTTVTTTSTTTAAAAAADGIQRRRGHGYSLASGLTVEKLDSLAAKAKGVKEDQERTAALQDVFLPSTSFGATGAIAAGAGVTNTVIPQSSSSSAPAKSTTTTVTTTATATATATSTVSGSATAKIGSMMGTSLAGTIKDEDGDVEMEDPMVRHTRGREVFGFQTQRKPTGLKNLIEQQKNLATNTTTAPTTAKGKVTRGSKANKAEEEKKEEEVGDDGLSAERSAKRRRVTKAMSMMNHDGSDVSEDSDQEQDEEESDSDDELHQHRKNDSMLEETARDATEAAGEQKSYFEEDEMGAERYFLDLYQKSKTSNNTLSKLPTLEHADFIQAIKRAPAKHAQEIEMLRLLYEEQFSQWFFELVSGFNLLIYGYGSKRQLLTQFATTMLTDAPLIIINGYFPTVTIKEILDKISSTALNYSGPTGSLQEQVAFIRAYFAQPERDIQKLYLLIHNIDGSGLRAEKTQSALSLLASCPHIHLIASIDHINANILWDTVKSARFNWVWHELTTFRPYLTETSFENSIMVRQGELGARGIQFVLASLTSNGKGLFRVLAEHQIQSETNPDDNNGGASNGGTKNYMDLGMAYNALFKKCQENFLVSNAVTFRTQLTEFRDHRIVQSKKGPDGVEILFIPLSASVLEGILDNMT
ncbi:Origin recognition complex subunit 2 [Mortierella hygrophila]|uniref:Origin recognition complex subunit 2 n=1 Tax=Mortierella hygrophila TaxID=979708 RepID=A0A9P6FIZ4_9FUNG|nr:Origin recognition complex subunit 2 [Mortierella hygrophila]